MTADGRARAVVRVIWLTLGLNLLVAGGKAAYGVSAGSLALQADALHSAADGLGNVAGLIGVWLGARAPDRNHPYGHRRFELLAAAFVGVLLLVGGWELAVAAFGRLSSAAAGPRVDAGLFGVLLATLVINVGVFAWERAQGRALGSAFLVADAQHTLSDVWVTLSVLAAAALSAAGLRQADAVAAGVVALLVLAAGARVLLSNLGWLADRAVLAEADVVAAALEVPGLRGVRRVRSRGMPGAVHLDLEAVLPPGLSLREAHELCHRLERHLRERLPALSDVVVHPEPDADD